MVDFLKDIAKTAGNEYAALVSEGVEAGDVESFIDTGSYIFNALLSGSIYGGLPANKITAVAGESATGKTFFVMGMVKSFLDANPDAGVLYFESESAYPIDTNFSLPNPCGFSTHNRFHMMFSPTLKVNHSTLKVNHARITLLLM